MKGIRVVMTVVTFMLVTVAFTQKVTRGDVCQNIPDLTNQQKSDISKLSAQHQKTMDTLRTQFRSETDAAIAGDIKMKISSEQNNHYQAISYLLTPGQKTWFDQNCIRNSRLGYGSGHGQGYGRGQGYNRGTNQGTRRGIGRGNSGRPRRR